MPVQNRDWEELTAALTWERKRAMAFLRDHLPDSDLDCYPAQLFHRFHGEPLGRTGEVSWFNQTARYADTENYTFRTLVDGKSAAGARFELQILNGASFHTVAVLTADRRGEAHAALGRGSLHVLAALDGLTAEGECGQSGITLRLAPPWEGNIPWTDFGFRAPADEGCAPVVLDGAMKAAWAETLRRAGGLDPLLRAARAAFAGVSPE